MLPTACGLGLADCYYRSWRVLSQCSLSESSCLRPVPSCVDAHLGAAGGRWPGIDEQSAHFTVSNSLSLGTRLPLRSYLSSQAKTFSRSNHNSLPTWMRGQPSKTRLRMVRSQTSRSSAMGPILNIFFSM